MDDDTPLTTYSPVRTRRSSKKEIPSEDLTIDNIHLAEFEDEDGEFVPRRSMRERKPLYTSMNTNLIGNVPKCFVFGPFRQIRDLLLFYFVCV